jgi:RNA polymerase sigma factor (TIGR02999 family)
MDAAQPGDVTQWLLDWSHGDREALGRIMPVLYDELCRLASHHLRREREDHTLQTSGLVHEAYLRLLDQNRVGLQNRTQFFGLAAQMMRRVLVDHARKRQSIKRGGGAVRLPLDGVSDPSAEIVLDIVQLDDALQRLAEVEEELVSIVELKFFGGLSHEEIGELLGLSATTIKRRWWVARAWLYRAMARGGEDD